METNRPWNWRLTVPKIIEMTLVRPLMANFRMTVRADCAVPARSPLPLSVKALAPWLSGAWSRPLDRCLPSPAPAPLLASEIKQRFLSYQHLSLENWLLSGVTISLLCGILKKWHKWTYLQNRNRLTDIEDELMLLGGNGGGERLGVWDWHVHTAIFKIDNQQGPAVQHRELCSILCNNLNGKRIWKRIDTCVHITESLCCTPETNTTLLINYTPIDRKSTRLNSSH